MYDTILVPTDGSDHAVRAAEHARGLARWFDATIHVLNVVDVQTAAGPFDAGGVSREFVERLEADGREAIETVESVFEPSDAIQTALRRGTPPDEILDYAADRDADLIAMGTHGRTGVKRYVVGSVTERVVRRAGVPVLTATATDESERTEYDEILVPTDGSEPAETAIDPAIAIARASGARVHAVNVVDVGSLAARPHIDPPTELVSEHESAGEAATERIASRARAAGLEAIADVRHGLPARDLLEYADANGIDLIAMGTTGRTGLDRVLLGSTAERIVRHAAMPVLTVNARNRDEE